MNGFIPAIGKSFDILDWGSLACTFSALQLPALPGGLSWNTSQIYATGTLSVGGVLGDYNHNGVVDSADYVVWRDGLGTTYTQTDYNGWRAHFGQTAASAVGTIATTSVPEPTTLVMVIIGALAMCSLRRAAVR